MHGKNNMLYNNTPNSMSIKCKNPVSDLKIIIIYL